MTQAKETPRAPQKGDEGAQVTNEHSQITAEIDTKQALAALFGLRNWVPWHFELHDNVPQKVPFNGEHGLSTKKPWQWGSLAQAQQIAADNDLDGVGLVMTGAIVDGDHTLVGIDVDKATADFVLPYHTYAERSPSGKGVRAFVWVPTAWATRFKDTVLKDVPHCKQVELYIGTAARFLTVTFDVVNDLPIAYLDNLGDWKLRTRTDPLNVVRPITPGTTLDLGKFTLSDGARRLLDGENQPVIDRSDEVYYLIRDLANQGASKADILATMLGNDTTWAYLLDHRNDDPARALQFAEEEVGRIFGESKTGMVANLCELSKAFQKPEPAPTKKRGVGLIPAADLVKKAGPIDWLVKDYFEANTVAEMFGAPGSYKSFLALGVAVAVASGMPWHSRKVIRQGPVVFVCGEGHNGIARRLLAVCQKRDIDPKTLPLVFSNAAIGLSDADNAQRLKDAISALELPPVLIVIDTLARNFGKADENNTADMNAFIANIDALRGDATVLIVHHTGHSNKERARGASSLYGAIDAEYRVEVDPDLHAVAFVPLKMKDAELPPPLYLKPCVVDLPFKDEDGQPVTSVVMEVGAEQLQARLAEVFKKYPKLKAGNRLEYLAELLAAAYDEPGVGQKELARRFNVSDSVIGNLVRQLRVYGLLESETVQLTAEGMKVTAILAKNRPDITFKAFGVSTPDPTNGPFSLRAN